MSIDPSHTSNSIDADTVMRWRIWRANPFWARLSVARLFQPSVSTGQRWSELQAEERRAMSRGRAFLSLLEIIAEYFGIGCVLVFGGFATCYGAGHLLGHPEVLAVGSLIVAAFVSAIAAGFTITTPLVSAPQRSKRSRDIQSFCLFALPPLMYAVASPSSGLFTVTQASSPSVVEWLRFFTFMASDIATLGASEAFVADWAGLKPPSLLAAAGTYWIKLLMSVGLIAAIINAIQRMGRNDDEFSCTLRELPAYCRSVQLSPSDSHLVQAIALETPFASLPKARTTQEIIAVSDWALGETGELIPLKQPTAIRDDLGLSAYQLVHLICEGLFRGSVVVFGGGLYWGWPIAALIRYTFSTSWTFAYYIAMPTAWLVALIVMIASLNTGYSRMRSGRAPASFTSLVVDSLVRIAILPVSVASLGVEYSQKGLKQFYEKLAGDLRRLPHDLRVSPSRMPLGTTGQMFDPHELDIVCQLGESPRVFHSKTIAYAEIKCFEYHVNDNWIVVVMQSGQRHYLGVHVNVEGRVFWESASAVQMSRTQNREQVESATFPLNKLTTGA